MRSLVWIYCKYILMASASESMKEMAPLSKPIVPANSWPLSKEPRFR